jgi:recombinational DNA repair protein (RecF pathway)
MKTSIEGILIRKMPYQERHLIGELLLRSGRRVSALFYGGQGGGKKQKSTVLEIGHLISVELSRTRSTEQLQRAKEWQAPWVHNNIRLNHQAFYLMCLYCEIMQKLSSEESLHDGNQDFDDAQVGLFKVLSNGLFYLDKRCGEEGFNRHNEAIIFIGKLLIDLGVFPIRDNCVFCDDELGGEGIIYLLSDHGGFSCDDCYNKANEASIRYNNADGRELWQLLGIIAANRYDELDKLSCSGAGVVTQLFHFFIYQFQFHKLDFKTLDMVL